MPKLVHPSPGHRALELVRKLVELFDSNFVARQYVRSSGKTELHTLETEARRLADPPPIPAPGSNLILLDWDEPVEGWSYCALCRAFHETLEDRRAQAVRSDSE